MRSSNMRSFILQATTGRYRQEMKVDRKDQWLSDPFPYVICLKINFSQILLPYTVQTTIHFKKKKVSYKKFTLRKMKIVGSLL